MSREAAWKLGQKRRTVVDVGVLSIILVSAAVGIYFFSASSVTSSATDTASLMGELLSGAPPTRGINDATVTIVEFGDFQCSSCAYWFRNYHQRVIQNLINTSKAKLIWRDFDYIGPDSTTASLAAYAAGEQGKFWEYYDLLYSKQQTANSGWANMENLDKLAQELGLNMTKFNESITSRKHLATIQSNLRLGEKLGVTILPTFFVVGPNNKVIKIVGAQPYIVFETAAKSVLEG